MQDPVRVTSVIASLTAGGIGSVCRYAAEGMARLTDWDVTLLSLHDPPGESIDEVSGLRIVRLGLEGNCAHSFLQWLEAHPQDLFITSNVSRIEPSYRYIPAGFCHVMQIHDSGRRYQSVPARYAEYIDGVICVGRHIEGPLQRRLASKNFH